MSRRPTSTTARSSSSSPRRRFPSPSSTARGSSKNSEFFYWDLVNREIEDERHADVDRPPIPGAGVKEPQLRGLLCFVVEARGRVERSGHPHVTYRAVSQDDHFELDASLNARTHRVGRVARIG